MVIEIAEIRIRPGQHAAFEAAIAQGLHSVLSKSPGFVSSSLHKGLESPERYVLHIRWQTLENHTVDFRESPAFPAWRALVGPFFAEPPVVEHFDEVTAAAIG